VENLRFFATVGGYRVDDNEIEMSLEQVGLGGRGDDFVFSYSTGMKQRLKYATVILRKPKVFLIDEPGVNLDESGEKIVFDLINSLRSNSIILIATNEREEYTLADELCQLGG